MPAPVWVGKTNRAILDGEEDLSLWSDEELLRGQKKGKNGRWSGRPPSVVPKAIHDEWVQRRMLKAHELLGENLVKAVQVLVDLATNKRTDDAVRLKAAATIMDRVLGKVPDHVMLSEDKEPTWAKAIRNGMVQAVIARVPADDSPALAMGAGYDDDTPAPQPHELRNITGNARTRRQREA